VYDLAEPLRYRPAPGPLRRGLDRYRDGLPLPADVPLYSLGEGGTPLVPVKIGAREVHFKCEQLNPTGSFKDRGTVVLVSALRAVGVEEAIEDSSGNAGASFAAYAARAGMRARVFVPDAASPVKRRQIESYGAEVVRIMGPRSNAAEIVRAAAAGGSVYASHAYFPHALAGMATIAYELVEALGRAPGALVCPVGQGTLALGAFRGFAALREAGAVDQLPAIVGVQAMACAPIWAAYQGGAAALAWVTEGETAAEGIRIRHPLRGDAVLAAVRASGGVMVAVDESQIREGQRGLGREGFFVEPTSAVVWPALLGLLPRLPDPVVVVLTGSGYKSVSAADRGLIARGEE
jgi:threonine synthase